MAGNADFHGTERERLRTRDLLELVPPRGESVLDIGARDGHLAMLLVDQFSRVVALDLQCPVVMDPRVECVAGDARALPYEDGAFETVVCAEVLEHIPEAALERVCREIVRVARHTIVIGVPYRQDLRYGRTLCRTCGAPNPPWGHLNAFDEARVRSFFADLHLVRCSYVGSTRDRTSALAATLMHYAGNPFGTYDQDEPCVHCGAALLRPNSRTMLQRLATKTAYTLDRIQQALVPARAIWIHARFDKAAPRGAGDSP